MGGRSCYSQRCCNKLNEIPSLFETPTRDTNQRAEKSPDAPLGTGFVPCFPPRVGELINFVVAPSFRQQLMVATRDASRPRPTTED